MNPRLKKLTPSQQLSTLADMLETDELELVPTDLAAECASLIREALQNGGKLRLEKGPGATNNENMRFERAFAVAMIMIDHGLKRKAAIQQVAKDCQLSFYTIEKDYSTWGKHVRPQARRKIYMRDELLPRIDDLRKLLGTFEHDDRSKLSEAEIDELFNILPADEVPIIAQKIEGCLRRDIKVLNEILS